MADWNREASFAKASETNGRNSAKEQIKVAKSQTRSVGRGFHGRAT